AIKSIGRRAKAESLVVLDVVQGRVFELMSGNADQRGGRDLQTQTFAIKKEKQLILINRSSEGSGPLIGNAEGPWNTESIVKPIVGVECAPVPIILCVSVKAVGA